MGKEGMREMKEGREGEGRRQGGKKRRRVGGRMDTPSFQT